MFLSLLCLLACSKEKKDSIQEGIYKGTFQRQTAAGGPIANIAIHFSANSFTGQEAMAHYPAVCNGTYTMKGDRISFQNACAFTADFDWSLILSNEYRIIKQANTIEIWREYESGAKDIYKLTRQ